MSKNKLVLLAIDSADANLVLELGRSRLFAERRKTVAGRSDRSNRNASGRPRGSDLADDPHEHVGGDPRHVCLQTACAWHL